MNSSNEHTPSGAAVSVEALTTDDKAEFLKMETGLSNDYVAMFFDELVNTSEFIKAVDRQGEMVGVGRIVPVTDKHAYLSSARVALSQRGKGIGTTMALHLIERARKRGFQWAGLCTNHYNKPVIRMMENIGMRMYGHHLSVDIPTDSLSSATTPAPITRLNLDRDDKLSLIKREFSHHPVYAYSPYQHIPWDPEVLTPEHLDRLSIYQWNDRIIAHKVDDDHFIQLQIPDLKVIEDLDALGRLLAHWKVPERSILLELPLSGSEIGNLAIAEGSIIEDNEQWLVYGLSLE